MKKHFKQWITLGIAALLILSAGFSSYAMEPSEIKTDTMEQLQLFSEADVAIKEDGTATYNGSDIVSENGRAEMIVVMNGSNTEESLDIKEDDSVVASDSINDQNLLTINTDAACLADAMAGYIVQKDVAFVQPNYEYELMDDAETMTSSVNDTYFWSQWALNAVDIGVTNAWDISKCSQSVKVGVLDTGVDMTHADLAANISAADSYDVVNNTANVTDIDAGGHGTHVSGIIAAQANNGLGVAGVSYNAVLCCYNICYINSENKTVSNSEKMALAYTRAVDAGCKVINISLGMYGAASTSDALLEKKINEAYAQNIITVCAGGNGENGKPITGKVFPGDLDACISVVPTNSSNIRASYADYNAYKDISAPGVSIRSTLPGNTYGYKSGSSMASPFVAGVAALLFAANPYLSGADIKEILYSTATDVGTEGYDEYYGNGLINANAAVSKSILARYVFDDVSVNDWYCGYVEYVYSNRIMTGMMKTVFGASENLSRAQFVTLLYRMDGSPDFSYESIFTDVQDNYFYSIPVIWAYKKSIVTGYNPYLFGPADGVTREQMVLMMYRYAKYKGYDTSASGELSGFTDGGDVSGFALAAVKWAVAESIITGDGGAVNPQGLTSRAACAAIIERFNNKYKS